MPDCPDKELAVAPAPAATGIVVHDDANGLNSDDLCTPVPRGLTSPFPPANTYPGKIGEI
jgi:hypothetical protein